MTPEGRADDRLDERDLSVGTEDLRERAAVDERAEAAVDIRPGILVVMSFQFGFGSVAMLDLLHDSVVVRLNWDYAMFGKVFRCW